MDWSTILLPSVPLPELVVRATITFLVILAVLRLVGQREAGGLGLTDVLLVVLIAQAAASGLGGQAHAVADGVILMVVIALWSVVIDAVSYRFPRLAKLLKAQARPLISNGTLDRKVMRREFITREEIDSQLRLHGVHDIAEVERANIEPNGMISIVRRDHGEQSPVEPPNT